MKKVFAFIVFLFVFGLCFGQSFGGGYKNTKWGMSEKQVKKILEKDGWKLLEKNNDMEYDEGVKVGVHVFYDENGKGLSCLFYQKQLCSVIYTPFAYNNQSNKEVKVLILNELKHKYGESEESESKNGEYISNKWNDSKTEIVCDISKHNNNRTQPDESVEITYKSILITKNLLSEVAKRKSQQKEKLNKNTLEGL